MYERPLITFGYIHVPLIPEYEVLTYLVPFVPEINHTWIIFITDLQTHRFSLIVTDPLPNRLQGRTNTFGEENDVFFTNIAQPMRCYYELVETIPEAGIDLYEPQSIIGECGSVLP